MIRFFKFACLWVAACSLAFLAPAQNLQHRRKAFRSAASPTWVINEQCEGTGTPSGWTDSGSLSWDFSGISGQSWQNSVSGAATSYYTIADANFYEVRVAFKIPDATPASTGTIFGLRTSAAAAVCLVQLDTAGKLIVFANGSASSATTDALSDNTVYYIKLIWNDSGTCSVEFSTTTTFAGSGTKYISKTGGTTSDCTRFYLGASTGVAVSSVFDDIKVDDAVITP